MGEKWYEKFLKGVLEKAESKINFKLKLVENLSQFNEGLDFLVELIESIKDVIYEALDYDLFFFGLLNESESELNDVWEIAKAKVKELGEKVKAVSSILRKFLIHESIVRNGEVQKFTRENCVNSVWFVNGITKDVEYTAEKYIERAEKIHRNPYPLDDSIMIYNISVSEFNCVLGDCRPILSLTPDELPDAGRAARKFCMKNESTGEFGDCH